MEVGRTGSNDVISSRDPSHSVIQTSEPNDSSGSEEDEPVVQLTKYEIDAELLEEEVRRVKNSVGKLRDAIQKLVQTENHTLRDFFFLCDELHSFNQSMYQKDPGFERLVFSLAKVPKDGTTHIAEIEQSLLQPVSNLLEKDILELSNEAEAIIRRKKDLDDMRLNYDITRSAKRADLDKLSTIQSDIQGARNELQVASEKLQTKLQAVYRKVRELGAGLVRTLCEKHRRVSEESGKSYQKILPLSKRVQHELVQQCQGEKDIFKREEQTLVSMRGYVYVQQKQSWKRKWMSVDQGVLKLYKSWRMQSEPSTMNLVVCRASQVPVEDADKPYALVVQAPNRMETIAVMDPAQFQEWMNALESNISYALKCSRGEGGAASSAGPQISSREQYPFLADLRRDIPNFACCDCGAQNPEWALTNYGVAVCQECAGVHRSFGVHISRIRSLAMDFCEPEILDSIRYVGNKKVNKILLHDLPSGMSVINEHSARPEREQFLRFKYVDKKFISSDLRDLGSPQKEDIVAACNSNDRSAFIKLLARGVNYQRLTRQSIGISVPESHPDFSELHLYAELNVLEELFRVGTVDLVTLELLYQGGVSLTQLGRDGYKPIHIAAKYNRADICRFLLARGSSVSESSDCGETPVDVARKANAEEVLAVLLPRNLNAKSQEESIEVTRAKAEESIDVLRAHLVVLSRQVKRAEPKDLPKLMEQAEFLRNALQAGLDKATQSEDPKKAESIEN